jgi:hypothetical protein
MHGSLLAIYIAPNAKAQMVSLDQAELQVGLGIVGDRYHQENGTFSEILKGKADKEVTLIESEQIDRFNADNDFLFIDFQKLNFQKCKKSPFEVMLVSAKKKPPKEHLNDNTKLLKINFGKAVRKLTDSQKAR